ncbi:fungal-specific transcription factor domain-containing protein [Dipodascopsis tothii]|uniref:fungal-specific transcription factor domain-containing protein n=1 Tax=Dipodascopsis tothii TaxID=44089 RepID=UPI0034CF386A
MESMQSVLALNTNAKGKSRQPSTAEKRYKCACCSRAFSRSEHRNRHERSHTKERPFKCEKCTSTFVRRDLLLRHDRTVHAKDYAGRDDRREYDDRRKPDKPFEYLGPGENVSPKQAPLPFAQPAYSPHRYDDDGKDLGAENMDMTAAVLMTRLYDFHTVERPREDERRKPAPAPAHSSVSSSSSVSSAASGGSAASSQTAASALDGGHHLFDSFDVSSFMGPGMGMPVGTHNHQAPLSPEAASAKLSLGNLIHENLKSVNVHENVISEIDGEFNMPTKQQIATYMHAYFAYFHPHNPFVHVPSFSPVTAPPPLLFALLSIGALYSFDRETASSLHVISKKLTNACIEAEGFNSRNCPLWLLQAMLINTLFAAWSGDARGLDYACGVKSFLANLATGALHSLLERYRARPPGLRPAVADWIDEEGTKRTYFAIYNFFGLLTVTYNFMPIIWNNEPDELPLPCSEALWSADVRNPAYLHDQLDKTAMPTFRAALQSLLVHKPCTYTVLGARVLVNALFLDVWILRNSAVAAAGSADDAAARRLEHGLDTWHISVRLTVPEAPVPTLKVPHDDHPLVFNSYAVYRLARTRLASTLDLARVALVMRYHDAAELAPAMVAAAKTVARSPAMTRALGNCHDTLLVPISADLSHVIKTSAVHWSLEHALCGFDPMLTLMAWLARMEHDSCVTDGLDPAARSPIGFYTLQANQDELGMMNKINALFDMAGLHRPRTRLSSGVGFVWAKILTSVSVWGLPPLMGEACRAFASSIENDTKYHLQK